MRSSLTNLARYAVLSTILIAAISCSSSDSPTVPEEPFTVVETFPAHGAVEVPVGAQIWARFSAPVELASLSDGPQMVEGGASGEWTVEGDRASFVLDVPLEVGRTYTTTLPTQIRSTAGKTLATAHSWSFTTESVAVPRPTVVSVTPANLMTDVDPATTITARFDRVLNPATVTAGGSFVVDGIAGSVEVTDSVAVFTPDAALPGLTTISVTLTSTIEDSDGAAMVSPYTWSFETAFVDEPWERAYGQPTYRYREKTYFGHVSADGDDRYYGFGVDNLNAYVVRTDPAGDVIWSRSFGPAISYTNEAFVVLDDGCLFAYTNQDVGVDVVRLDDSGSTQVETSIAEVGTMRIYDMIEASDGNFVMAGVNLRTEDSQGLMTFWAAKIDANANVVWQHAYPDSVEIDEVTGIAETPDGGFMITGSNWGLDGRGLAMRTDSAGSRLWVKRIPGNLGYMTPYSIIPATDGGYVVAGTHLQGSEADGFFAKIDEDANTVWEYDGGDYDEDWAYHTKLFDVVAVPGGYVAAGHEGPAWDAVDALLVMFDLSGNVVWSRHIGGDRNEYLRSVTALPNGDILAGGYSNAFTTNVGQYQAYMLKAAP